MKSAGNQLYSYTYVVDAVAGILTVLLKGEDGEAYNIADKASDITLKELAKQVATIVGTRVVMELPDKNERAGYSKATKAVMSSAKLQELGWKAQWNIKDGIMKTIECLSNR